MRARAAWALRGSLTSLFTSNANIPCWSNQLPRLASIELARYSFSTAPHDPSNVLRALHGAEFQHQLEQLRKQYGVLPYTKFLEEFRQSVPSATAEDATRITDALAASGSILRHGTLVYLRPTQVAAVLRSVLPVDVPAVRTRLQRVKAELAPLEAQREAIIQVARRRTSILNYTFFAAMASQWGILFRLTYWELSWDVMEPVGFFVGGASSLLSFAWFLRTRQDFTYEAMHQRFMSNYERQAFENAKFDIVDYNRLTHEAENLRELLEAHEEAQAKQKYIVDYDDSTENGTGTASTASAA